MAPQLNKRETEILARLSDGLTDQQIADELFLSLNTIKWYNRQIYGKLGVASRTQAIACAAQLGLLNKGAALPPPLPGAGANLPASTSRFIGRSREIAEVKQQLAHSRLLTLTGSGGTGKTRLALRVAAEVAAGFANGVGFVDLAPLADPELAPETFARALGVVENANEPLLATLKRALAGQELLLLVDNFEHVVDAAPLLTELLAAAPRLKALVTSRESLRLSGEQTYPVPPLSLPQVGTISPQQLLASEAGALFVQRAQESAPHFAVTAENAAAIAQLCLRLGGLPLAIELAAARCKLLSPQQLLDRLAGDGDRSPFATLGAGARDAPARQRTLRDSINWSYELLDGEEKRLFARLAVFRGGRSLEAVESVCGDGLHTDVFEALASLVDKSLLQQKEGPGGEPRFVMLEMIHEYGRERLEAGGEAPARRRRHAAYFVQLAERAEPELRLSGYDHWCARFELELDNIRAALEWTLAAGDFALGVRLAAALGLFWYGKGRHVEGIRWTRLLLPRLEEAPPLYQVKFLINAGTLAWLQDLDMSQRRLRQALQIARELGDELQAAWAQALLAYALQQDPQQAFAVAAQALGQFRDLQHLPGIAQTLNIIGEVARMHGDDGRARIAYEECLAICRQTGEVRRTGYMLSGLAYIAQHEGDYEQALALARQCLQLARDRNDRYDLVWALELISGSVAAHGKPGLAVKLLSASEAALARMGSFQQPTDQPEHERIVRDLKTRLDPDTFQKVWEAGRNMTLAQAADAALQELDAHDYDSRARALKG